MTSSTSPTPHDAVYSALFSTPEVLESLIRTYLPKRFSRNLDFQTVERLNAKFHTDAFQRREGDLIFRIQTTQGHVQHICVLLEFQSSPDRFMALRVLLYTTLLFQHLIQHGETLQNHPNAPRLLPPVLPIVLFTHPKTSQSPNDLRELIDCPADHSLWDYQPSMQCYFLYTKALASRAFTTQPSWAEVIVHLEHMKTEHDLEASLKALLACFDYQPNSGLERIFIQWLDLVLLPRTGLDLPQLPTQPKELPDMLSEYFQNKFKAIRQEGHREGRQEVYQQVLQEARSAVVSILEKRFGAFSWVGEIQSCDDSQALLSFAVQAATVSSLDEAYRAWRDGSDVVTP